MPTPPATVRTARALLRSTAAVLLLVLAACTGAPSATGPATNPATGSGTPSSGTPSSVATTRVHDAQRFTARDFGDGPVQETVLHGASSGVTMTVWVWTPPQYDDPAYAHTDFPVLFLYPGGDGATYNNWTDRSYSAMDVVRGGTRDGSVLPFVFVMPEMQVSSTVDTECTDLPGEPAVGTLLDTDVPRMVTDDFRVLPAGKGWGTAGASAGAYCAAAIAYRHPEQYGAVVSIAGYFTIETDLPGRKNPAVAAQSPAALVGTSGARFALLVVAGTASPDDVTQAQRFAARVVPPATVETYLQPGGGHLTTSFRAAMPNVLGFLSEHLTPPTPSPTPS